MRRSEDRILTTHAGSLVRPDEVITAMRDLDAGRALDETAMTALLPGVVQEVVSRQHATIRRDKSETIIEDHSSTNGVFVNAKRVEHETLSDGDEITIGESRFRYQGGEPAD